MRVAIVHDWLNGMRGGERVLEILSRLFSNVDVYTLFYEPKNMSQEIQSLAVTSSILQSLPNVHKYYRYLLPIYPLGIADLNRKLHKAHQKDPYDMVISISHCVAKNIKVPSGVYHLCYCLTPVRYLWDQFDVYFKNRLLRPLISLIAKPLRRWDVSSAKRIDRFIGISEFVCARIAAYYKRDSTVIYPPVSKQWAHGSGDNQGRLGFLCVNALVPYKNVEAVVLAFNQLQLPLTVVGRGPEKRNLMRIAMKNINFKENITDRELAKLYQTSRALVFAAEEDFGMTPVEMQFAGGPVIALAKGGALETVSCSNELMTGVFFDEPTPDDIVLAVRRFIELEKHFSSSACRTKANQFSIEGFNASFIRILNEISGNSMEPISHAQGS